MIDDIKSTLNCGRENDGYINIRRYCIQYDLTAKYLEWLQLPFTLVLFDTLQSEEGIELAPDSEYLHPLLFMEFMSWVSPEFDQFIKTELKKSLP